jgi:hypothetical protein
MSSFVKVRAGIIIEDFPCTAYCLLHSSLFSHIPVYMGHHITEQEILEKTDCLLSFDTTRTV